MQIKSLEAAGLTVENNLFLAPLAGYTNYPFRTMYLRLGAGLTYTEMVSAKGLAYGSEETKKLLFCKEESPKAAQIFGSDPALMRRACESEELAPFDLVDINMGCPVPKVVKNGEGSALMENLPLAEKIVEECVKSGKRISVKFRVGVKGKKFAKELAKRLAGAGACLLTVHGRTREAMYAGEVDYSEIASAKNAVSVPVVANGGIFTRADAEKMMRETGADGVMIARAALYDMNVFRKIAGEEPTPILPEFLRLAEEEREMFGERFALVFMRKLAAFFLKGTEGVAPKRRAFFECKTTDEVKRLAEEFLR